MKALVLLCGAVQVFCFAACGQLLLNSGDSWSYAFGPLSRTGSVSSFVESPNGAFTLSVDGSPVQGGVSLRYEMFENNLFDPPICSQTMTSVPPFSATCQVAGSWQDLQGAIRLSLLSGSLSVTSITVRVVKSGPSLSSYDVYASTFVPIPGPALSAVLHGDKLLVSWPQAGANDYDLQTATNLSGIVTWQNVTNGIYPLGTNYYATNDISGPFQLFRLRSRQ